MMSRLGQSVRQVVRRTSPVANQLDLPADRDRRSDWKSPHFDARQNIHRSSNSYSSRDGSDRYNSGSDSRRGYDRYSSSYDSRRDHDRAGSSSSYGERRNRDYDDNRYQPSRNDRDSYRNDRYSYNRRDDSYGYQSRRGGRSGYGGGYHQSSTPRKPTKPLPEEIRSMMVIEHHHIIYNSEPTSDDEIPQVDWCPKYMRPDIKGHIRGGTALLHHRCRECQKICFHLMGKIGQKRFCLSCGGYDKDSIPGWYYHSGCKHCR